MQLDTCLSPPGCTLGYETGATSCSLQAPAALMAGNSSQVQDFCAQSGTNATFVVSTATPGVVMFEDSVLRMFGDPRSLDPCPEPGELQPEACYIGEVAEPRFSGFPVGAAAIPQIRLRTLAFAAGNPDPVGPTACERVSRRRAALRDQCNRTVQNGLDVDGSRGSYRASDSENATLLLGAVSSVQDVSSLQTGFDVSVISADHPIAAAARAMAAPDGLQPDGLMGSTLLRVPREMVLNYTGGDPGILGRCRGDSDTCLALPECLTDGTVACCHGLPDNLLLDLVAVDEVCCGALRGASLAAAREQGHCL